MGDNFLKRQVRNAKHRCDRAMDTLEKPTLFDRPELMRATYPVEPVNGHQFNVGEVLWGVAAKKGKHIDVTDGHTRLGTSSDDAAQALREELGKPCNGGVTKLKVVKVWGLSGVAEVRIVSDREGG
jgi:hypothetical protein